MQKFILISVLLATFALPTRLARRAPGGEYSALLRPFAIFTAIYVFLLLFIYPRLF